MAARGSAVRAVASALGAVRGPGATAAGRGATASHLSAAGFLTDLWKRGRGSTTAEEIDNPASNVELATAKPGGRATPAVAAAEATAATTSSDVPRWALLEPHAVPSHGVLSGLPPFDFVSSCVNTPTAPYVWSPRDVAPAARTPETEPRRFLVSASELDAALARGAADPICPWPARLADLVGAGGAGASTSSPAVSHPWAGRGAARRKGAARRPAAAASHSRCGAPPGKIVLGAGHC